MATPKQLDAVFFFIKNKTQLGAEINDQYIWNFYVSRTPELNIDNLLFGDIVRKLIKDNYVYRSLDNMFHVSADGRNFKGYVHQNRWYRKLLRNDIVRGVIYTLIAAAIIALITWAIKVKKMI